MGAWRCDTRGLWDGGLGVRCLEAGESSGRDTSRFGVRGPRGKMPLAKGGGLGVQHLEALGGTLRCGASRLGGGLRGRRLDDRVGRAWGARLDIGEVVALGAMPGGRREGDLEA
uniref:Uncharacterized protein n=1 Tax=Solanum lycopersicum TaxID=4081 RepID=A0A3Q7FJ82_SOLLC